MTNANVVYQIQVMQFLLSFKVVKSLTITAISVGSIFSAYSAQAATFRFTLGDLPGGGTLEFDDLSLTGANREIVKGANLQGGALNWNILIGEATWYTGESDANNEPISREVAYYLRSDNRLTTVERLDTFQQADFIFERGVLTGIQNYSWYLWNAGGRGDDLESRLNLGVESPASASLSVEGIVADIEGAYLDVSISRSNLPINFSVIEPWDNSSRNIPEPTFLLASGLALGGLLLKKRLPR